MKQSFNYLYIQSSQDTIEIEDIGNIIIEANNDLGQSWLLWISTLLGFSYIIEYGPYSQVGKFSEYVNSNFQRIEYSEYKLEKKIDKFLNEPKRFITQVSFIDEHEARQKIKNMVEVFDEAHQ